MSSVRWPSPTTMYWPGSADGLSLALFANPVVDGFYSSDGRALRNWRRGNVRIALLSPYVSARQEAGSS
jgi:hypothetical protein